MKRKKKRKRKREREREKSDGPGNDYAIFLLVITKRRWLWTVQGRKKREREREREKEREIGAASYVAFEFQAPPPREEMKYIPRFFYLFFLPGAHKLSVFHRCESEPEIWFLLNESTLANESPFSAREDEKGGRGRIIGARMSIEPAPARSSINIDAIRSIALEWLANCKSVPDSSRR